MMSETPAVELVSMSRNSSMANQPDISGQILREPFSRSASVETKVAPEEKAPSDEAPTEPPEKKNPSDETPTEPPEKDCETESETVESDDEEPEKQEVQQAQEDAYDFALGAGSMVVFGGMLVAAVSYFLSKPVIMQHPYNSRDFF